MKPYNKEEMFKQTRVLFALCIKKKIVVSDKSSLGYIEVMHPKGKITVYTEEDKYLRRNTTKGKLILPIFDIIKAIKRRECLFEPYMKDLKIIDGDVINCSYINETIVANYEEAGLICLYRKDKSVDKQDLKIVNIVSSFLTKYLEE